MSISRGFVVNEMGTSTDINWNPFNVFKKSISANTTFTFSNIEDKEITLIVSNTSGSDRILTFPSMLNSVDLVSTIRAGKTTVFKFASADGDVYCIFPVKSEAIYA